MTQTLKIDAEILICIAAIAMSGFFVWKNSQNSEPVQLVVPIIAGSTQNTVVAATSTDLLVETTTQPSPDGTKKLTMNLTHNKNGTLYYVFKTASATGANEKTIYTITSPSEEKLRIPFNTWSPDDKYVFIQNNSSDALVFKATGDEIISGQQYLNVRDIFNLGKRSDVYNETTGWASQTLLIVNTLKLDNTKGSSYWFEVPSKAIIQLSSQF